MKSIYLTVQQIETLAALARGDGTVEYGINEQPVVHGIEIEGDAFATTQINAKAVINGRLDAIAHTIILENGTTNGWAI